MNSLFKPVLAASFTALIIVAALFLSFPIAPKMPFTLAVFFVWLSGVVLGPFWSFVSVGLYLALGLLGLPVFANGASGLGTLLGPTGGFLVGYLVGAVVIGILRDRNGRSFLRNLVAVILGFAATYLVGLPWFHVVMAQLGHLPHPEDPLAAVSIMAPFMIMDLIKVVIAAFLGTQLARPLAHLEGRKGA